MSLAKLCYRRGANLSGKTKRGETPFTIVASQLAAPAGMRMGSEPSCQAARQPGSRVGIHADGRHTGHTSYTG